MNILMETFVGVPRSTIDAPIAHLRTFINMIVSGGLADQFGDARELLNNIDLRCKAKSDIIRVPLRTLMQVINYLRIYADVLHAIGDDLQREQYVRNACDLLTACEQAAIKVFIQEHNNGK